MVADLFNGHGTGILAENGGCGRNDIAEGGALCASLGGEGLGCVEGEEGHETEREDDAEEVDEEDACIACGFVGVVDGEFGAARHDGQTGCHAEDAAEQEWSATYAVEQDGT